MATSMLDSPHQYSTSSVDQPRIGRLEFIALMAALQSMNALAIDIMLPALGTIAHDFKIAAGNERQFIVTAYILGMSIGSIIYGSLADRFGRKPILLICLAAYTFFAVMCVLSNSFSVLLIARLCQGLAGASMVVLTSSIIRDRYEGDAMARLTSTIMMTFMIVPVIAPSIGQLILLFGNWHEIFILLGILSSALLIWVFLRLPETLHPEYRIAINLRAISQTWRYILSDRNALGHVIASGLVMGGLFGYISSAQQLIVEAFDSGAAFGLIFAAIAGGLAVANFTNSRIVERFGARRVSQAALITYVGMSVIHAALAAAGVLTFPLFVILLAGCISMIGFTGANFSSIAMQPFGGMAGAASSFQTFVRSALGTGIGAAIGLMYDGSERPLVFGFLLCGIAAFLLILWAENGKLFQRRNFPATLDV
ncbi:MAG: multidrug effflux MFS transporter [Parasphingorhabdus sp.]|nr:multidrug effflux MFS transporter [Parasphingorhabdus sp.]